ncbi:MAG: GPI inositol-deacylase [Nitrospiraceae bacterium]|nr:GPI inositol-deacylase [Nitrospiraceae bacterium]
MAVPTEHQGTTEDVLDWLFKNSTSAIAEFEEAQLTEDSIYKWLTSEESPLREEGPLREYPENQVWAWLTGAERGPSARPEPGFGADEQARIAKALDSLRDLLEEQVAQRPTALSTIHENALRPPLSSAQPDLETFEGFDEAEVGDDEFEDDAEAYYGDKDPELAGEIENPDHATEGDEANGGIEARELDPVSVDLAEKTSGGGPLPLDGVPEHVPDLTFIVEARIQNDRFMEAANTYHTNCGLRPVTIRSIEHLVTLLSTAPAHIGRMRIVTHAHPNAMAVRMFDGSDVFQVNKEWLVGFADDDVQGLRSVLGIRAYSSYCDR